MINPTDNIVLPVAVVDGAVKVQALVALHQERGIVLAEVEAGAVVGIAQHLSDTSLAVGGRSLWDSDKLFALDILSPVAHSDGLVEEHAMVTGLRDSCSVVTGHVRVAGACGHLLSVGLAQTHVVLETGCQ